MYIFLDSKNILKSYSQLKYNIIIVISVPNRQSACAQGSGIAPILVDTSVQQQKSLGVDAGSCQDSKQTSRPGSERIIGIKSEFKFKIIIFVFNFFEVHIQFIYTH